MSCERLPASGTIAGFGQGKGRVIRGYLQVSHESIKQVE